MFNQDQMDITSYQQKYFRPSCLKALNVRFDNETFSKTFAPFDEKTHDQIQLPPELTKTPEDTLFNYFSLLREAANTAGGGCGTIGQARLPFPIAYNFLSKGYQNQLSYEAYLDSFAGIGHTNLIKLWQVPDINHDIRFFYEVETIKGFEEKNATYFSYAYGFILLAHDKEGFRIASFNKMEEDFLCAPYHGWEHDAQTAVEVKYGNWCHLIQHMYLPVINGVIKYIGFHGHDGADYCLMFVTVTNGTDIEIAQFRKVGHEPWKQIHLKPEACLSEKRP